MTLIEAYEKGGWLLVAAVGVTMALRFWRVPGWQKLLPRRLQWERWEPWVRCVVLLLVSLVSSVLTGLSSGQSLITAILAALPVTLGAHLAHKGSKAVGYAMTANAVEQDWEYKPGPLRRAASIVVPLDTQKIMAHNIAAKTHAHRKPNR